MTLTLEEAQARLPDVIRGLRPGEEVAITAGSTTVAKLVVPLTPAPAPRPGPGLLKGGIVSMADDFDAPLDDLSEYTR
jgi:antitoxin (DNA-binding transcriptional repressor) of toxin-antitoxin stability system